MKSYVVIGLGRFGTEMALKLYNCGEDVMAIDTNEVIIDKLADRVTKAVAADARDLDVLKKLGVDDFDGAIVAVGSDLGASALITMNLKTLGVPYILCKAHDDTYREILEKLGADRVIIPEREMADKLAMGLTTAGVMEYIELSNEYGIVEMTPRPRNGSAKPSAPWSSAPATGPTSSPAAARANSRSRRISIQPWMRIRSSSFSGATRSWTSCRSWKNKICALKNSPREFPRRIFRDIPKITG